MRVPPVVLNNNFIMDPSTDIIDHDLNLGLFTDIVDHELDLELISDAVEVISSTAIYHIFGGRGWCQAQDILVRSLPDLAYGLPTENKDEEMHDLTREAAMSVLWTAQRIVPGYLKNKNALLDEIFQCVKEVNEKNREMGEATRMATATTESKVIACLNQVQYILVEKILGLAIDGHQINKDKEERIANLAEEIRFTILDFYKDSLYRRHESSYPLRTGYSNCLRRPKRVRVGPKTNIDTLEIYQGLPLPIEASELQRARSYLSTISSQPLDDSEVRRTAEFLSLKIRLDVCNVSPRTCNSELMVALHKRSWNGLSLDVISSYETSVVLQSLPLEQLRGLKWLEIYPFREYWSSYKPRGFVLTERHPDTDTDTDTDSDTDTHTGDYYLHDLRDIEKYGPYKDGDRTRYPPRLSEALDALAKSELLTRILTPHSLVTALHASDVFSNVTTLEVTFLCSFHIRDLAVTISSMKQVHSLSLLGLDIFKTYESRHYGDFEELAPRRFYCIREHDNYEDFEGVSNILTMRIRRFHSDVVALLIRTLRPFNCERLAILDLNQYQHEEDLPSTLEEHTPKLLSLEHDGYPVPLFESLANKPAMLPALRHLEVYMMKCYHGSDEEKEQKHRKNREDMLLDACLRACRGRRRPNNKHSLETLTINRHQPLSDAFQREIERIPVHLRTRTISQECFVSECHSH